MENTNKLNEVIMQLNDPRPKRMGVVSGGVEDGVNIK